MAASVPTIVAGMGMMLVASGLSAHAIARVSSTIGAIVAPIAGTQAMQQTLVDAGQANTFVVVGVSLAVLAGWLWLRRR